MASTYPELAVLGDWVAGPVILDGEIAAIRGGRPDFGALQSRMHIRHPPPRLVGDIPVRCVLDLLHQDGQSLVGAPPCRAPRATRGTGPGCRTGPDTPVVPR